MTTEVSDRSCLVQSSPSGGGIAAAQPSTVMFYQWLLALHIIAVIAWMAGVLYLPRLFVYHCAADPGSMQSETFQGDGAPPAQGDHQIQR